MVTRDLPSGLTVTQKQRTCYIGDFSHWTQSSDIWVIWVMVTIKTLVFGVLIIMTSHQSMLAGFSGSWPQQFRPRVLREAPDKGAPPGERRSFVAGHQHFAVRPSCLYFPGTGSLIRSKWEGLVTFSFFLFTSIQPSISS